MLLFELPHIIKISYEEDSQIMIHEWLEYNPDSQDDIILDVLQKIYEIHLAHPVEKVMVRADAAKGIFSPEIQKYIRDVQFPRLVADTKIKFVVTIKSPDALNQMAAKLWQKQFDEKDGVLLNNVSSENDARQWLETVACS